MRTANRLKEKLRHGLPVVGTWFVSASSNVAHIIAHAGFDFIIVDMEHGPCGYQTAEEIVRAVELEHQTPLIRVPGNRPEDILRCLETGAHGVIVPQISSAEAARAVVQAVKYHPQGERGFSPYTASAGYAPQAPETLAAQQNERTFVGLIVEGAEGFENLGAIAEQPGVDLIYIGLYDLSQSLGVPGESRHPKVLGYLSTAAETLQSCGVSVGTIAQSSADIQKFTEMGIKFLAFQADCAILSNACRSIVKVVRKYH